jgi:hypothetical protein
MSAIELRSAAKRLATTTVLDGVDLLVHARVTAPQLSEVAAVD